MHREAGYVVGAVFACLTFASSATSAGVAQRAGVTVWYRSVEGCPNGAEFLGRLESRKIDARLARVGDPVDFVVTLGTGASGSTGLLERQTSGGIVAVRTVEGDTCDQVANALALTLTLVAEGQSPPSSAVGDAPRATAEPATPAVEVHQRPQQERSTMPVPERDARANEIHPPRAHPEWLIGLAGTLTGGVSPAFLPGGALFGELGRITSFGSSVRIAISAGSVSSQIGADAFRLSLLGGRFEACPATIGATLRLTACAALDVGSVLTSGAGTAGPSDSAAWSALALHARLALRPAGRFAYEAQIGAIAPLTRYELGAAGQDVAGYRTASVGFAAGLGAGFRIP